MNERLDPTRKETSPTHRAAKRTKAATTQTNATLRVLHLHLRALRQAISGSELARLPPVARAPSR